MNTSTDLLKKLTVLATSLYESRLCVGLMEYVPQKPAGMRTDPPGSKLSHGMWMDERD